MTKDHGDVKVGGVTRLVVRFAGKLEETGAWFEEGLGLCNQQ